MKYLLLLSLVTACASGALRPIPRAGDPGTMMITNIWNQPRKDYWQQSKWFRYESDLTTPAQVIISGDYACVLEFPDINDPQVGQFYPCSNTWRYPR